MGVTAWAECLSQGWRNFSKTWLIVWWKTKPGVFFFDTDTKNVVIVSLKTSAFPCFGEGIGDETGRSKKNWVYSWVMHGPSDRNTNESVLILNGGGEWWRDGWGEHFAENWQAFFFFFFNASLGNNQKLHGKHYCGIMGWTFLQVSAIQNCWSCRGVSS